jgi:hypothetical protein
MAMNEDLYDKDKLDEMRRKLYARSGAQESIERHRLTDTPVDVARNWEIDTPAPEPEIPEEEVVEEVKKPKRRYRLYILAVSMLIFFFGAGLSTIYLYLGGNEISSDNISLSVDGPLNVGGGEVLNFSVDISNQNTVPMKSATLIVKYPQGTRSVGDVPRTIFEQRIPVAEITPGAIENIPLQVVVFGEEQDEQQITATIEYRVSGSNSVFFKEAEPYEFSISSSPIVLRVKSVEKVSSGQMVDIELTVVSNASAPQRDLLISASYPNSFRFESSQPSPVFGNTVWSIDELLPEEEVSITLRGVVTGFSDESLRINFDLGPAQSNDPFIVGSLLAEADADFIVESPFIEVTTKVDGDEASNVVLEEGENSRIELEITNTLNSTVYDMLVEVVPGGNILNERSIQGTNGFYDSNSGTIKWEVANNNSFELVGPGESRLLNFTVSPSGVQPTASYDLVINVYARRVAEPNAADQLIGTALIEAKYDSTIFVGSQAGRGGVFTPLGVIPPQVGETTSYTVTLVAEAGVNDLTDAVVETRLPIYVDWRDSIQGEGELTFNTVSQQLEWDAGSIPSGTRKEVTFQLSITPSSSQIGSTPVLLQSQTLRATDRFTDTRLQAQADPVYTELSTEAGFSEDNGRVIE